MGVTPGLALMVGFEGAMVGAALFLAIVGFAWPTRGNVGKPGFQQERCGGTFA